MTQTFKCPKCGMHMEVQEYINEACIFGHGINIVCECDYAFNLQLKVEKVSVEINPWI